MYRCCNFLTDNLGGVQVRIATQFPCPAISLPVQSGRGAVLLFEEFDKVRGVGDVAVVANLRHRLAGGDEQQAGLQ